MKTVLITGSNGQLGTTLKEIQKEFSGFQYFFHDIDTLDITNPEALQQFFSSFRPSFVINCAAYTAVDKAEQEPAEAERINVTAVENLLTACKKYHTWFIHLSTDYVFDGNSPVPYSEEARTNPLSVYGKTKEKGERLVVAYPGGIVIRTSWLYSPYGNNFVKTILRLSSERQELKVVADQVGSPTYSFDLATAILHLISRIESHPSEKIAGLYHYSNEGVCSWYDFAKFIVWLSGHASCKVIPIETSDYPLPARRPSYSVMNKNKIKNTLGIEIPHWCDSLKECLRKMGELVVP